MGGILLTSFSFALLIALSFNLKDSSIKDESYIRYLNVVAVDDVAKKITCMFGGARSGEFQMHIRHSQYGLVDTPVNNFGLTF